MICKTTDLRDTLLVLPSEQGGPSDSSGVLALEEKRLGLASLETKDFAVTANIELPLFIHSTC